ncbi:MAG: hypothetical protein HY796_07870, partial [Elusimicrobia bacterium]|nr:hypothetical protein [Elusimicrobiota bacterium]
MKQKLSRVNLTHQEIEKALAQAKAALAPEQFNILENVVYAYLNLLRIVEDKATTIKRLRRMLFGPTSEKTEQLLEQALVMAKGKAHNGDTKTLEDKAKRPPVGHGRNGHNAYWGAKTEFVPHHSLKPGDRCPACHKGKVYEQRKRPKILVRVTGQP